MTISSSTSKNQYTSTGENTFTYTFKIFDESDIRVLVDGVVKTITTDYTVTGTGNDAGGTVVFNVATTSGAIITLKRNEPLTQEIDYVEGDNFPASAHEEGLDRSAIRDQFLQEQIDRTITLPEDTTSTLAFTNPAGNGGKFLTLNTGADEVEYTNVAGTLEGVTITSGDAGKPVAVNSTEDGFEVGDGVFLTADSVDTGELVDAAVTDAKLAADVQNAILQDSQPVLIEKPKDQDYRLLLSLRKCITITSVTTRSVSGTCTATLKINTTALGGTANAVSSSEVTQAHVSANVAVAGDDIVLTISANASCVGLSINIFFEESF